MRPADYTRDGELPLTQMVVAVTGPASATAPLSPSAWQPHPLTPVIGDAHIYEATIEVADGERLAYRFAVNGKEHADACNAPAGAPAELSRTYSDNLPTY